MILELQQSEAKLEEVKDLLDVHSLTLELEANFWENIERAENVSPKGMLKNDQIRRRCGH